MSKIDDILTAWREERVQPTYDDLVAVQAEQDRERQSVPALTDDWITRHSMLGADCAGASTVVLASSLRRLLAAAHPQPVQLLTGLILPKHRCPLTGAGTPDPTTFGEKQ